MENSKNFFAKSNRVYLNKTGLATCASLANEFMEAGNTVVIMADGRDDFYELLALSRLFSPALSLADYPITQTVWQRPLLSFPTIRRWSEMDAWALCIANMYALSFKKPACIVARTQSLLLRYMPLDFFNKRSLDLAIGNDLSPDLIIDQAVEWGYTRVPMVTRMGEIAKRGDILDIFPPGYAKPARLEFFGDNIDEMRLFDGDTQRSLENIPELTLIPASPAAFDDADLKKVYARLKQLYKAGKLTENEAYSLKKRLEQGGNGILPGILFENNSFFEDWLPQDTIWILLGEADGAETLVRERAALKEELEADEEEIQQPASLTLRRSSQPAPWNSGKCIFAEPLRMGIDEKGISMPERDFHSFQEFFPLPQDRDRPWQTLIRAFKNWQAEYRQVILTFSTDRGRKKFLSLAEQDGILPRLKYSPDQNGTYALIAPYRFGAVMEWDKIIILGEDIIFPRAERQPRKASRAFKGLDNFESLKEGDLMVHRDYGICRYEGLQSLEINDVANDFILLEFSGQDKLYIPVDKLGVIQRFKGQEGFEPALDRLGTQAWVNGKEKARKAIEKIAADLVEMYAYRKVAKGFIYGPVDELYHEFEATFGFEETADQARAIQEVLDDMDSKTPMDRLVCGDVGFGKTEVALRAAFRAASEGRQVALLCPTTILAEQHYQTFRSRLSGFPVNVGLLSRFVPKAKQKEILKACEQGEIDILIGTHRILSNDVKLPNLALLILDEEQRFGVRHKEKLKSIKKNVDVLTLTATPIPRTLQLSMSGIRDLSIIETAPLDRKPVASAIIHRDDNTLRNVIKREMERHGQVFWVYNRVNDLEKVTAYVKNLVPEARVGMAHGQMGEKELETTMRQFWHGELDVLVSTSIVESGLDFPRANTLVVDQAQMFGLGQLYQLRGRVGRSDAQAYAYFVVPDARKLTEIAEERLRIILNMDYLGAGFQVAMEDLRLRGAGNILGEVQSGHMARVGLDLYLEMLEDEVKKLKGQPLDTHVETELSLALPANIPSTYIEDGRERLRYYKSLTSAQNSQIREEISLAMRDRFGQFPEELRNFLAILDFKQFITRLQVEKADVNRDSVKLIWRKGQDVADPRKLINLVSENKQIKLAPPAGLIIPIDKNASVDMELGRIRNLLENIKENSKV